MRTCLPLLCALAGCFPPLPIDPPGGTGAPLDTGTPADADSGTGDGGDGGALPIWDLDELQPAEGSNGGGYQVHLRGGPFDGPLEVWFGDLAAEVVHQSAGGLVVELGPSGLVGPVDVRVLGDEGAALRTGGFVFHPDATGQAVALVLLEAAEWATPDWVQSGPHTVQLSAMFIEPTDIRAADQGGGALDQCLTEALAPVVVPGPSELLLSGAAGELLAEADASTGRLFGQWEVSDPAAFGAQSFDLSAPASSASSALNLPGAVRTAAPLIVHLPDLDGLTGRELDRADPQIGWTGDRGDFALITLQDTSSGATIRCAVVDDGAFSLDPALLDVLSWSPEILGDAAQVVLTVASVRETDVVLETSQGEVRTAGAVGQSGLVQVVDWWL